MNAEQRKTINAIISDVSSINDVDEHYGVFVQRVEGAWDEFLTELGKLKATASDILARIEEVKDAEQEAFDNWPEGIQSSEKGEQQQEAINALDNAQDHMQMFIDTEPEMPELSNDSLEDLEAVLENLNDALGE